MGRDKHWWPARRVGQSETTSEGMYRFEMLAFDAELARGVSGMVLGFGVVRGSLETDIHRVGEPILRSAVAAQTPSAIREHGLPGRRVGVSSFLRGPKTMPHANTLSASLLLILMACGGGTEPPDPPTADIKADGADAPLTVLPNVPVHLSWSSQQATSCLVSPGGWSGTTGSAVVEDLPATTTYRLSCTGPGGEAEDTVHIVLNSPPGTQIVFQSSDSTDSDIYVVNADGSGLTRLTDYPDADLAPSWSSDGRQIYFLSYNRDGRGTLDLYAMNANGTDVHLVVDSILGFSPGWPTPRPYAVSPDERRLALGGSVLNVDGSDPTRILDLPCDEYYTHCEYLHAVAWSPDGQRIAYSACWAGHGSESCGIGVVNADGSGQRVLATFAAHTTKPAWAPDGQRIVFSSSGTRTSLFYPLALEIINVDGTGRMFVPAPGGTEVLARTSPSWSPDGQSIVFAQFRPSWTSPLPEQSDLFVVNVDGTGFRHVTTVPGGAFAPDWTPVP